MLAMYLTMLETDADRERFAHLYDVCNKLVFATAFSILKNKMQAEDAAQHTWMNVIDKFDRISQLPLQAAKGYLVVMADNIVSLKFCSPIPPRSFIHVNDFNTLPWPSYCCTYIPKDR